MFGVFLLYHLVNRLPVTNVSLELKIDNVQLPFVTTTSLCFLFLSPTVQFL
jgi:hypothetical protein